MKTANMNFKHVTQAAKKKKKKGKMLTLTKIQGGGMVISWMDSVADDLYLKV